jgi:hypothetical protein
LARQDPGLLKNRTNKPIFFFNSHGVNVFPSLNMPLLLVAWMLERVYACARQYSVLPLRSPFQIPTSVPPRACVPSYVCQQLLGSLIRSIRDALRNFRVKTSSGFCRRSFRPASVPLRESGYQHVLPTETSSLPTTKTPTFSDQQQHILAQQNELQQVQPPQPFSSKS